MNTLGQGTNYGEMSKRTEKVELQRYLEQQCAIWEQKCRKLQMELYFVRREAELENEQLRKSLQIMACICEEVSGKKAFRRMIHILVQNQKYGRRYGMSRRTPSFAYDDKAEYEYDANECFGFYAGGEYDDDRY